MRTVAAIAVLAVTIGPVTLAQLWWNLHGRDRFRRRSGEYVDHVRLGGTSRCRCDRCASFRREMGWRP